MEIRKVERKVAEYPTTNDVPKEEIKKKLPKKFLKFAAILAVVQSVPNKVHAILPKGEIALAGDIEYVEPISIPTPGGLEYIHPVYTISTYVGKVSVCALAVSVVSIVITKIVHKVKKIENPVPKGLKILALISGILSLLAAVGILVFGN